MTKFQDIKKSAKKPTAAVTLYLNGEPMADIDLIEEQLRELRGWKPDGFDGEDPRVPLQESLKQLQAEVRASKFVFKFRSLGDKPWADLLAKYPPREGKENAEIFNPDTFPAPLIAAACVDPEMSQDQVKELFELMTTDQRQMLFNTAFGANIRGVSVPFSSGSSAEPAPTATS